MLEIILKINYYMKIHQISLSHLLMFHMVETFVFSTPGQIYLFSTIKIDSSVFSTDSDSSFSKCSFKYDFLYTILDQNITYEDHQEPRMTDSVTYS
jgi:hypothetical protein